MHTITPHLAQATIHALWHLSLVRPKAAASTVPQTVGVVTVGAVVVVLAFVTAMVRATRRFAALIAEFLQLAAAVTSYMFTVLITVALFVIVLMRH